MRTFYPSWTIMRVSLSDLALWSHDEDRLLGAQPELAKLCKALGLDWDVNTFAREHFGDPGDAGTGDVYLCKSASAESLVALDLCTHPTDQYDIVTLAYRCDANSYEASLAAARRIFDQAEYPVSFEQGHVVAKAEELTDPANFPRQLSWGYTQRLHIVDI
ncbi:hypothetical protein G7068_01275 [Leucobacter viscericola]|uniref:Uncharacterized protein n=1 Tax=Leucobacter viscericola TaxID=2714935 RepID=A0A6G7XC92_9MICO|nr:hypothetical protein [Leucobacter viscericola]QIK61988.1 hypothetical protein G7068_01275 [Leucobacter viscericola]